MPFNSSSTIQRTTFGAFCFLTILIAVFGTAINAQSPSSTRWQDVQNAGLKNEQGESFSAAIESPEPGVRLYGTGSLFATWTHTDLSPDGQWLVGFQGTRMLVWDRQAGRIVREFDVIEQGNVEGTSFSPNGSYLAIFAKHWVDLPVLNDDSVTNETETEARLDSLLTIEPKFRSQVLIYDREWNLVGEYDVSTEYLDRPGGMTFNPDESAILMRGAEGFPGDPVVIIDLKDKLAIIPPSKLTTPIWFDSYEIVCPRTRGTWNYRTEKVGRLPDDFMRGISRAYSMSDNGDWVLTHATNVKKLFQLSTRREIPLHDTGGYTFGHVSPDNRYFLCVGFMDKTRKAVLLDLMTEKEIAREETWQVSSMKFVRNESVVHLSLTTLGAGARARSVALTTIPLDENFSSALLRAQAALPVTDKVLFAGQDRWLVLSNGWSWLHLETGNLAGLGHTSSRIAQVAAHPETEQVFTFGAPKNALNNFEETSVTLQGRQPNQGRLIFKIQPPTEIVNYLQWLMGRETNSNSEWSVNQQHLSTSSDGGQLRIVHSESKSSGQGLPEMRYQLTIWDIRQQKKLGSKTLESIQQSTYTPTIVKLSPDGKSYGMASASRIGWGETENGHLTKKVNLPGFATSLEFSADNRFVAVGLVQWPWQLDWRWPIQKNLPLANQIALIEIESGLIRFQKKNVDVVGFGFHPQSHQLLILDRNHQPRKKRLTVYKPVSWEPEFEHQTEHSVPLAMAMSSDGKLIAIPLADTRVEVWELQKMQAK